MGLGAFGRSSPLSMLMKHDAMLFMSVAYSKLHTHPRSVQLPKHSCLEHCA